MADPIEMARKPCSPLLSRGLIVLKLAARRLSKARIADALGGTIRAITAPLASIYRTLGVANRTEAPVFFLEHGSDGSIVATGEIA